MLNSQKIKYNLIVGFGSQILTIALGILLPRLVLVNYGSEVNGLINSITQIYTYIGLLEAGIGTATEQALYRTVGQNNQDQTNAVLSATNRYFKKTGILYIFAMVGFAAIYPALVDSGIPTVSIILIILCNGVDSVVGFFFQRKYFLLLNVEGKGYVQSLLATLTNVLRNVIKLILISCGFDVVIVQFFAMLVSLMQTGYLYIYIKRNYQWVNLKEKPDYASISQSKNVLIHQVSKLVFNNTDSIILTVFCGLKMVSVYSTYAMLFGMISTALSIVINSIVFTMGQAFHADRGRFLKLYDAYELCYMTLVFALYSVANFFVLPFIKCYTAGITDISYVDQHLPLLMITTYLLSCGRSASGQVINIAGHFKKTQYRSLVESFINITVSLIAVQFWGIYGVLIGTIVALLYRANDMILYANHKILSCSAWCTYKRWIVNTAVFTVILFVNPLVDVDLSSYGTIILFCIPYTLCTLAVFFGVAFLTNGQTAKYVLEIIKNFFRRKY